VNVCVVSARRVHAYVRVCVLCVSLCAEIMHGAHKYNTIFPSFLSSIIPSIPVALARVIADDDARRFHLLGIREHQDGEVAVRCRKQVW